MKHILALLLFSVAAQAQPVMYWGTSALSGTNLTTDLISYWKMDDASGATRVDSQSSNNLLDGGANITQVAGKILNAANSDGTAGHQLACANNASLQLGASQSFTWSIWFKATTLVGTVVLVDKGSAFDLVHDEYLIYFPSTTTIKAGFGNGTSSAYITTTSTFSTATWYHLVVCFDNGANKLHVYVNGSEDASSPATPAISTTSTTGQLSLFEASSTTGFRLNGVIDEVGFWKRALTSSEVSALYNSGSGLAFSNFPSTP